MTLVNTAHGKRSQETADLQKMFKRPLIMGASVSADWGTQSPSKRLALRYTTLDDVRTLAMGGRRGVETLRLFEQEDFSDRSIILAIDLFFWDSVGGEENATLSAIQRLFERAKEYEIPLVLGEVPELIRGHQPLRDSINAALHSECAAYESCVLMPFSEMHRKVLRDGYLEMNKKRLNLPQIVPDGLHLSSNASEFLADQMSALIVDTLF